MQVAHKIELKPNNTQKTYLDKAFGVARFSYNWGLVEWNKMYEENKNKPKEERVFISGMLLNKKFNSIKKEQFPWTSEVTKFATQKPLLSLDIAFKKFFNNKNSRPQFKKKGKSTESFSIDGEKTRILKDGIKAPNLKTPIKMTELLRFSGKINSATFSKRAGKYFVSIQIETADYIPTTNKGSVGVDLGVKAFVVTSDMHIVKTLKPLKSTIRKLKRQQRKLSKKTIGSKNRNKQKAKITKTHYKISCKRKDILHKTTTFLVTNYSHISIENLNVKGMVKNHNLAQSISDAGFGEFRRQLEYKTKMMSVGLTVIDRFYPSSKTCSSCGEVKKDLLLKDRLYNCSNCGLILDRDLNAAININKIGKALAEFTPVEITALQKSVYPYFVSSIIESGIKHQAVCVV